MFPRAAKSLKLLLALLLLKAVVLVVVLLMRAKVMLKRRRHFIEPPCGAVIDVNKLKAINDTYGCWASWIAVSYSAAIGAGT